MRSAADRSTDRSADRRATVVEAAEILGITPDAVRSRLRRGTLQRSSERGPDGEVLVVLPWSGDQSEDQSTNQSATDRETVPTVDASLVEALQDQIDHLRQQLDEAHRANAEHRRLLAAALERIPEIEPAQETDREHRDAPVTSSNVAENSEPQSATEGTQEPSERRSWLYRFFFGPS